jgi:hypothetical protein
MGRIIKLTEQDLARIVRRVINERQGEGKPDPQVRDEGGNDKQGADRDWWTLDLAPKLKAAGFVSKTAPEKEGYPCYYKCCTYMYKGTFNTGPNVFLDCTGGNWKITVYNKGNQNLKTFDAGADGAKLAVKYALSLG